MKFLLAAITFWNSSGGSQIGLHLTLHTGVEGREVLCTPAPQSCGERAIEPSRS